MRARQERLEDRVDLRQRLDAVQEARPAGDQHERDGFAGGGEDAHEVELT